MNDEEWTKRIEARLATLETLAEHCTDPEDREIDRALRRVLKASITFVWLVKNLTLLAGVLIGAKLAWDQIVGMFR
jgi:hypothetical protein